MPTPQMTLRVSRDRLLRWKQAANLADTSISEQIRSVMDDWAEKILAHEAKQAEQ